MLTEAELSRYDRQLALPEVGLAGQQRLRGARVLVVGAGGLGSPVALYLAAAGVGTIGLVDDDTVEVGNLHRQILHGTADVGLPKTTSAARTLRRLNPHVVVREHRVRLTVTEAESLFREYDLVVDGSDNYSTRYAVNDACAKMGKPWVYGSVERYSGQISVFGAADGPCYRCLFPEPPAPGATPSCEELGVLGAVPGVVGSVQAVEALKCLLGIGAPLVGRLWQLDFRTSESRVVRFDRRDDCPICGNTAAVAEAPAGASETVTQDIEPGELARKLLESNLFQLLDIRERWEWSKARIDAPQTTLLPMSELEGRVETLDKRSEMVVYCHHGARSSVVADWLRARGYRVRSLAGGIDRWSREVDPSIPRY